jgi:transcriptional regulator with XRE-family HTH domain
MIERIKKLIEKENTTPSAFADEIGISRGSMNHILNGRNNPSLDMVLKIVKRYPNINLDWLMQGTPPIYKGEKASLEPDLFSELSINPINESTEIKYPKEIVDKLPELPVKPIEKESITTQMPTSKNIDKIMIFFKDKTFLSLLPEE